jgi:hypothetical protein
MYDAHAYVVVVEVEVAYSRVTLITTMRQGGLTVQLTLRACFNATILIRQVLSSVAIIGGSSVAVLQRLIILQEGQQRRRGVTVA